MDMILVELDGSDVTGDPFDAVMEMLLSKPEGVPIDLVFRDRSAAAAATAPVPAPPPPLAPPAPCVIRAFGTNGKEVVIEALAGDNLRRKLLDAKVDVYDTIGKVSGFILAAARSPGSLLSGGGLSLPRFRGSVVSPTGRPLRRRGRRPSRPVSETPASRSSGGRRCLSPRCPSFPLPPSPPTEHRLENSGRTIVLE